MLFNIGALHTQIGARQDRACAEGASRAAQAFQLAAGEGSPDPAEGPPPLLPGAGAQDRGDTLSHEYPLPTGTFSLLRENFSQAPSPDMSTASLSTLEQLMAAQAQECVFEGLSLPALAAPHDCVAQLHLAQEAAQVRPGSQPCPGPSTTWPSMGW